MWVRAAPLLLFAFGFAAGPVAADALDPEVEAGPEGFVACFETACAAGSVSGSEARVHIQIAGKGEASAFVDPQASQQDQRAGVDVETSETDPVHVRSPGEWEDPSIPHRRVELYGNTLEVGEPVVQTKTGDPPSLPIAQSNGPSNAPEPSAESATEAVVVVDVEPVPAEPGTVADEPSNTFLVFDVPSADPSNPTVDAPAAPVVPVTTFINTPPAPAVPQVAAWFAVAAGSLLLLSPAPLIGAYRFFARFGREKALDHPLRDRVYRSLQAQPWTTEAELVRTLMLPRSTVRHHLAVLLRTRLIQVQTTDLPRYASMEAPSYRCDRLATIEPVCAQGPARLSTVLEVLMARRGYTRAGAWKAVRRAANAGSLSLERAGRAVWVHVNAPHTAPAPATSP